MHAFDKLNSLTRRRARQRQEVVVAVDRMRCHNSVHMTFSTVVVFVSVLATRPLAIDFLDLTENTTATPERSVKEEQHSSNTEDSGLVNENAIVVDGFCKTWIGTVVEENSTWEEHRCRKCRCDAELGTVCQEPKCQIAFHPLLESNCEAVRFKASFC